MKKFSFCILAVLLVAVSCNKEEFSAQGPEQTSGLVKKIFNAVQSPDEISPEVKTVLSGQSVRWSEGDSITIFDASLTNRTFSDIQISDDGRTATFSGLAEDDDTYTALYPVQETALIDKYGIVTATVPSVQTAVAASFGPGASLSIAVSKGDSLQFKNVCALLAVKINNDDIKSVTISATGTDSTFLTGMVHIDYNNGDPKCTVIEGYDNVTIAGDLVNGNTYYATVCPGTYSDFKITYTRSDGKAAVYKNNSLKLTLARCDSKRISNVTVADTKWQDGVFADVVRLTNSTACISWTTNAASKQYLKETWPYSIRSNYDWSCDLNQNYKVQVFTDAACTNLQFEKTIDGSIFNSQYPPRFTVSGLTANKKYYYKVLNLTSDMESVKASFKTTKPSFTGTVVTSNAKRGDVILYESFDKLVWNGDLTTFSAGYSFSDADFQKMSKAADGTLSGAESSSSSLSAINVQGNQNYGLFNTAQAGAVIKDLGFSGWAYSSANGAKNTQTAVAVQPGFLKVGQTEATKYSLFTPAFNVFDSNCTATVKVTFKACKFASPETLDGDTSLQITAVTGGTVSSNYLSGYTVAASKNVKLSSTAVVWKEYSATLTGVPTGARFGFCHSTSKRYFIDDIKIEIVSLQYKNGVSGKVLDSKSNPIENVLVTDGFSVVQTDENGVYSMEKNSSAKFVYITVPADCEVPYASDGYPLFYKKYSSSTSTYNFSLKKLSSGVQTKWNMLISTDNHTNAYYYNEVKAEMNTMKSKLASLKYSNLYAFNLGDLVSNSNSTVWDNAKNLYSYANSGVHFFTLIGNHDHFCSVTDTDPSEARYMNRFGPLRYSVDRGNVHILMMDNVIAEEGVVCGYHAGFTKADYNWLKKDLALVDKNKTVVLCTHCGFRAGNSTSVHGLNYYHDETLQLLSEFKSAMLFSGHNHRSLHYNHKVNGKKIHETTFVSSLGVYGHDTYVNADGALISFAVISFDGNNIVNKHFHTFGGGEYMLRMHDGNASTSGTYLKNYGWGFEKGVIVANVFFIDYTDKTGWKVELYQGGKKCCDMSLISSSMTKTFSSWNLPKCTDIAKSGECSNNHDWWQYHQYLEPSSGKKMYSGEAWPDWHTYIDGFDACSHLYYGKLTTVPSGKIMDQTNIEVRVTDPYGNVYSRKTFTKFVGGASKLYFRYGNE